MSDFENSKNDQLDEDDEADEKQERRIAAIKSEKGSSSANSTPTQPSTISYSRSWLRGMNYIGKMAQGVKSFYNEMNSATLTGAIDVVVVKQRNGSFKSSPFHVRFGKMALIKTKDLTVDIEINGQQVDLHMRLGEAGEAYFFIDDNSSDDESVSSSCESLPDAGFEIKKNLSRTNSNESADDETQRRDTIIPNDENTLNDLRLTKVKFYSDGEATPESNPSRPMSPKSDSEALYTNNLKVNI